VCVGLEAGDGALDDLGAHALERRELGECDGVQPTLDELRVQAVDVRLEARDVHRAPVGGPHRRPVCRHGQSPPATGAEDETDSSSRVNSAGSSACVHGRRDLDVACHSRCAYRRAYGCDTVLCRPGVNGLSNGSSRIELDGVDGSGARRRASGDGEDGGSYCSPMLQWWQALQDDVQDFGEDGACEGGVSGAAGLLIGAELLGGDASKAGAPAAPTLWSYACSVGCYAGVISSVDRKPSPLVCRRGRHGRDPEGCLIADPQAKAPAETEYSVGRHYFPRRPPYDFGPLRLGSGLDLRFALASLSHSG
jgi:hypothetical protein